MRLWSLHPRYLDARGLVALWREGLLARKVLQGRTRGYTHHPQLERFKGLGKPLEGIDAYLAVVCEEAARRGYAFDRKKIRHTTHGIRIPVTTGQLHFELSHLLRKLWKRDRSKYRALKPVSLPRSHPLFRKHEGPVASWERHQGFLPVGK